MSKTVTLSDGSVWEYGTVEHPMGDGMAWRYLGPTDEFSRDSVQAQPFLVTARYDGLTASDLRAIAEVLEPAPVAGEAGTLAPCVECHAEFVGNVIAHKAGCTRSLIRLTAGVASNGFSIASQSRPTEPTPACRGCVAGHPFSTIVADCHVDGAGLSTCTNRIPEALRRTATAPTPSGEQGTPDAYDMSFEVVVGKPIHVRDLATPHPVPGQTRERVRTAIADGIEAGIESWVGQYKAYKSMEPIAEDVPEPYRAEPCPQCGAIRKVSGIPDAHFCAIKPEEPKR